MRRRVSEDKGATLVELALSSIVLFSFVFGIMDMSLGIYAYHFISEAAREGTRYAIVRGASAGGGTTCASYASGNCQATSTQIQSYVKSLSFPGISAANMTVTPSWSAYTAGATCGVGGCNYPGDLVTVAVRYSFPVNIPFVSHRTLTLNSTAAMVIAQ
ncbi:MAG TPA: TadE/TadG family type IV pilus assembly protein [Acidobacteriaceae bacterium]